LWQGLIGTKYIAFIGTGYFAIFNTSSFKNKI
jgi:hypothetical protein